MGIINKQIITEHGLTFNRVESVAPYYFCTHDNQNTIIITDYSVIGKTDTLSEIFGADTYQELLDEINTLGLTIVNEG